MNTWEKIPFKDCVTICKAMGCLAGGYLAVQGPQNDKLGWWILHNKSSFWHGRAFPEPSILRIPGRWAVHAPGRCLMWPLDAKSSCPLCCTAACVSPSHGQNKPGSWPLKELKGNSHGFCRSRLLAKHWRTTDLLGQASLQQHITKLTLLIWIQWIKNKNLQLLFSLLLFSSSFSSCVQNRQINGVF